MDYAISFHYANSQVNHLPFLQEEDDSIYSRLAPFGSQGDFFLDRESYTSGQKLSQTVINHKDNLWLFHYSGHAGVHSLFVDETEIRSEGLANQLAQCPQLVLIVLNGCSTKGQVQRLLDNGAKVIISTSAPVEDEAAKNFSIRFYEALTKQATIQEAFEIAIGEIQQGRELVVSRGIAWDQLHDSLTDSGPVWAIRYLPENEEYLSHRLPIQQFVASPKSEFIPNQYLIDGLLSELWEAIKKRDRTMMLSSGVSRESLNTPLKCMCLISSLAAPLGELLRRLMAPTFGDTHEGYDKIGLARLKMIIRTYQVTLDMIVFTILSQIWEGKNFLPGFQLNSEIIDETQQFINLNKHKRERYQYLPFLKAAKKLLSQHNKGLFVKPADSPNISEDSEGLGDRAENAKSLSQAERRYYDRILGQIKNFLDDPDFHDACTHLEIYRQRILLGTIRKDESNELTLLCEFSEKFLSQVIEKLGLFVENTLATIKAIQVSRNRSMERARFEHRLVKLIYLLGKYEDEIAIKDSFMDSKSVLLLDDKEESIQSLTETAGTSSYLSFSPFIIDVNAFDPKADLAKICFFHHYDLQRRSYFFYDIKNPRDNLIEVKNAPKPDNQSKYEDIVAYNLTEIWDQFEAFRSIIK